MNCPRTCRRPTLRCARWTASWTTPPAGPSGTAGCPAPSWTCSPRPGRPRRRRGGRRRDRRAPAPPAPPRHRLRRHPPCGSPGQPVSRPWSARRSFRELRRICCSVGRLPPPSSRPVAYRPGPAQLVGPEYDTTAPRGQRPLMCRVPGHRARPAGAVPPPSRRLPASAAVPRPRSAWARSEGPGEEPLPNRTRPAMARRPPRWRPSASPAPVRRLVPRAAAVRLPPRLAVFLVVRTRHRPSAGTPCR